MIRTLQSEMEKMTFAGSGRLIILRNVLSYNFACNSIICTAFCSAVTQTLLAMLSRSFSPKQNCCIALLTWFLLRINICVMT